MVLSGETHHFPGLFYLGFRSVRVCLAVGGVWGISKGSPWSGSVVRFVVSLSELSGDFKYIRWLSGASVFVEMRRD